MKYLSIILLLIIGITACDDKDDNYPCEGEARPGLNVIVRDAVTDAVITDAVVVAADGSFEETLTLMGQFYVGVYDRAAIYTLTVTKPGYITYSDSSVPVNSNGCHAITHDIVVTLHPE